MFELDAGPAVVPEELLLKPIQEQTEETKHLHLQDG